MVTKAVTNTFSPGVNTSFSSELNENNADLLTTVVGHYATSQTTSTYTGVTETLLTQVSIDPNVVTNGVIVLVSGTGLGYNDGASVSSSILKMYGGPDENNFSNNTLFETKSSSATNDIGGGVYVGLSMMFFVNTLTWSTTNYIQVTGQNGPQSGSTSCDSIQILYL